MTKHTMHIDKFDVLVDELKEAILWVFEDNGLHLTPDEQIDELDTLVCKFTRNFVDAEE